MRIVVQRVLNASVRVEQKCIAKINKGLLVLIGVGQQDNSEDVLWLVKKLSLLRIFADELKPMNKSLNEVSGEALLVSQFTLHASYIKGNRPSFLNAAPPEKAEALYNEFVKEMEIAFPEKIQCGKFAANMQVALTGDGPVTIIMDSKNRE